MIKKYVTYCLLIILMVCSIYLYKYISETKKYQWDGINIQTTPIKRVVFTNGVELTVLKSKNFIDGKALVQSGSSEKVLIEDDFVHIDVAFPHSNSAKAAIISHQCSGNSCKERPSYLVIPEGGALNKYFISDFSFRLEPEFSKKELIAAVAKKVRIGQDVYASDLLGEIKFAPEKGFVISHMKEAYTSLLNEHLYYYFENKTTREPLVKAIGLEKFREIRKYMAVGSGAQLVDYRYLTFVGCMAHNCDKCFGVIIVDTVNDDLWWLTVKDKDQQSGGTKIISKDEIFLYKQIIRKIKFRDDYSLDLDSDGKMVAKIKK